MKQIEILYFASCPGWRRAVERVHEVVVELGLGHSVSICTTAVETEQEAQSLCSPGSPTVRVDARDVDTSAIAKVGFGLQCRLYQGAGGIEKLPSADLI